ncbi:MAG: hypothetical protein WC481_01430 [Candidatus Omnitrophota bacterium]
MKKAAFGTLWFIILLILVPHPNVDDYEYARLAGRVVINLALLPVLIVTIMLVKKGKLPGTGSK